MVILQDCREKRNKHDNVETYLKEQGYDIKRVKLNVGDYMFPHGKTSVDLKKDCSELANDLYRDKKALNKKYKKCLQYGIRLVVLIEEPINGLESLRNWTSPYTRINGSYLANLIHLAQVSYGIGFVFCSPQKTAQTLLKILKE